MSLFPEESQVGDQKSIHIFAIRRIAMHSFHPHLQHFLEGIWRNDDPWFCEVDQVPELIAEIDVISFLLLLVQEFKIFILLE